LQLPKVPPLSGKRVCRILEQNGFEAVRQRGSHIIMQKQIPGPSTITVPVPNHHELRKGTLLSIIRQSQLPRSAFEK
jgi:predicted RNA binding protein YcfA (HicA-like mRNA interferase family)